MILSVRPSARPSARPPVRPSVRLSARPSVRPSVRPPVRPSVRPSARPSVRPKRPKRSRLAPGFVGPQVVNFDLIFVVFLIFLDGEQLLNLDPTIDEISFAFLSLIPYLAGLWGGTSCLGVGKG